jgi:hypothetical protein
MSMMLLQCTNAYFIRDMLHESLLVFINTFVTQPMIKSLKISEVTHLEGTKFWRLNSDRNMIQQFYFRSNYKKWNSKMTNVMHKFLILAIYFSLTCFRLFFSPSSDAGIQFWQWFNPPEYEVSTRALTPYSGGMNHCQNCIPASEDGLKESPKHVRER